MPPVPQAANLPSPVAADDRPPRLNPVAVVLVAVAVLDVVSALVSLVRV